MANFLVLAAIVLIVGAASLYIVRAKKRGVKCIGCPEGCSCPSAKGENTSCGGFCAGCSGCQGHTEA